MSFMFARVVGPVLFPGTTPGADQGAVQQHHHAALRGDLLQRPVQARGAGGEQVDHLDHPAPQGRGGDVVTAGQVGQALVMAQESQDQQGLPSRVQLAPA